MSAIGTKRTSDGRRSMSLLGAKRTWCALRCGYDPLVQFRRRQWRPNLPKMQKAGGFQHNRSS